MNKICRLLSQHLSGRAEVGHEEFRTFLPRGNILTGYILNAKQARSTVENPSIELRTRAEAVKALRCKLFR